jgi:DNA replication protein DnaC
MTNRYHELAAMLRTLNLSRMATTFEEVAVRAVREGRSHEAFLHELARLECEHRQVRRIERRTRASGLPLDKTFRTLQLAPFGAVLAQQIERLRSGAFVQQAVNLIAVGRPGVGKSHVAAAVGHELIGAGHTVLWTSTAVLVQRLLAAKRDLRLPQELAKLDRFACLILDDIGYVQQSRDEMEVVFTLLAPRYPYCTVPLSLHPIPAPGLRRMPAAAPLLVPAIVRPLPPSAQLPQLPAHPHLLAGTPRRSLLAAPSSPAATARRSVSAAVRSGDDSPTNTDTLAASALSARS